MNEKDPRRSLPASKMPPDYYQGIADLEEHYWWHQLRYALVLSWIERFCPGRLSLTVADLGCGTGGALSYLKRHGYKNVTGYEYGPEALEILQRKNIQGHKIDLTAPHALAQGPFDVVLALDVMEHIEDDAGFVSGLCRNLKPGGIGIVMVPAHPFLFSKWDRHANHHRRYTAPILAKRLQAHGNQILYLTHLFSYVFPMAFVRKWTGRFEEGPGCEFPPVPDWINGLLKGVGRLEQRWLAMGTLPFGTSLGAVIRKAS